MVMGKEYSIKIIITKSNKIKSTLMPTMHGTHESYNIIDWI